MTALTATRIPHDTAPRRPRCPYCGAPYTPNPAGEGCRSCRDLFSRTAYIPQWDRDFINKLAWAYIAHCGEYVKASRLLGCGAEDVRDGRKILARRYGFVFESDRHLGTRLVDWARPSREEEEKVEVARGQLSLEGVG